ncbi:MAG TPA: DUF1566 domain-containing protein [Nevskia sp.]|nr:DUF1566 domain-containing protein [Nevskia sp.]
MSQQEPRFIKLTDGCVRDTLTGLEWTPTLNPDKPVGFKAAQKLPAKCELLGGGWQVPEPAQLASIVDYDRYNPAIDTEYFPDTKSGWYWTSKKDALSPSDCAWTVYFYGGYVNCYNQVLGGFVRAVRRVPAGQ